MREVVDVTEVDGVECSDVHLNLLLTCPLEGRVERKLQRREIHQGLYTFGGELPLHCSNAAHPILILTICHAEQRVEDGDQPFAVDRQEGETIKALQAAP